MATFSSHSPAPASESGAAHSGGTEGEPSAERVAPGKRPHFVFVAGLHRSGTTLLTRCLAEHPSITGLQNTGVPEDEGQHLQSIYPTALQYGGAGDFAFAPEMHLTEASPLATAESAERLWESWLPYCDASCPLFVEKSPPNLLKTRFLQALYPDCKFVVLLRHPVAVSYATRKWSRSSVERLVQHWLAAHEIFASDRRHLRNLFVLRYEDFTRDPQRWLDRIYRFLGVESVPNRVDIEQGVNEKYFAKWKRHHQGRPGFEQLMREIWRYEWRVRKFGYSIANLRK